MLCGVTMVRIIGGYRIISGRKIGQVPVDVDW